MILYSTGATVAPPPVTAHNPAGGEEPQGIGNSWIEEAEGLAEGLDDHAESSDEESGDDAPTTPGA